MASPLASAVTIIVVSTSLAWFRRQAKKPAPPRPDGAVVIQPPAAMRVAIFAIIALFFIALTFGAIVSPAEPGKAWLVLGGYVVLSAITFGTYRVFYAYGLLTDEEIREIRPLRPHRCLRWRDVSTVSLSFTNQAIKLKGVDGTTISIPTEGYTGLREFAEQVLRNVSPKAIEHPKVKRILERLRAGEAQA
jgi:hypothetical protein